MGSKTMTRCVLWTKAVASNGYGQAWKNGKVMSAHRVAYEEAFGTIPEGMCVCHHCDVKTCVNPEHLYLATAEENTRHAKERGLIKRGSDCFKSKLSEEQAREIKAMRGRVSGKKLAKEYGVSDVAVYKIWNGENWGWL